MGDGGLEREVHFESLERQAQAVRMGMWVFLGSEFLLFGGLFTAYAAYRAHFPSAFRDAVRANTTMLGSVNTLVLLTSSFLVAAAVHALERDRRWTSFALVLSTACMGVLFLAIKFTEYAIHFSHGIYAGGHGEYFERVKLGEQIFYTLYFAATGLHALHVTIGTSLLGWCAIRLRTRRGLATHVLEVCAMYWHLVDIIWIFIWPCFYLMRG